MVFTNFLEFSKISSGNVNTKFLLFLFFFMFFDVPIFSRDYWVLLNITLVFRISWEKMTIGSLEFHILPLKKTLSKND